MPEQTRLLYRDYHLEYDPPPIPLRTCDWRYWHRDFDGPGDHRAGYGPTAWAVLVEIDVQCDEEA